ncbi:MAG: helix-turn-helix domain-containing protein [bacterium]|nr:helix-turn-helix domain-containing protein [bacterium]
MSLPYLTAHQVAELLQLNVETVYALITRAGLPATRIGRRWRFDESRVRKWFHEHCSEAENTGALQIPSQTSGEPSCRAVPARVCQEYPSEEIRMRETQERGDMHRGPRDHGGDGH